MSKTADKMGVLPVRRLLGSMSLPPMISMLAAALYNVVDGIFVAKVSTEALAAITLVFPVQMLMMAFNTGVGVGLSSLISRRLGEKRFGEANAAATHGFAIGIFLWVLFTLFALFFAEPFLRMFTGSAQGTTPEQSARIFEMALVYCRIVVIGGVFMIFCVVIERILQSTGNMLYPMIYTITGCVINTALAPIFIIGYFGVPGYGVTGAGAVAITGQGVSFIIAVTLFTKKKHAVHVSFKGFRPRKDVLKDILTVAAPSIVMMAVQPILISSLNAILIFYSETAVAVLGAYFRISNFVVLPIVGLNQGALPIMGYNYGARNRIRLTTTYGTALKLALVIMTVGTAIFWLFPHWIMMMFNADPEMVEMGTTALRAISISWIPGAFVIVSISLFQALAHGVFALIISVVRQLGAILPVAWLLAYFYGVGMVWYAYPIAEVSAFTLTFIFYRVIRRKEIIGLPDGAPAG